MVVRIYLLVLTFFVAGSEAGATEFACPDQAGEHTTFQLSETLQDVSLSLVKGDATLCTLALEPADSKGVLIPIARTYDGHDWERGGGSFGAKLQDWICDGDSCTSVLPGGVGTYFLHNRQVTGGNAVVRFLESASFGATREEWKSWNGKSFAQHVKDQTQVKPTYHREYFRRRVNKLWNFHQPEFAASLDPCQANPSYWYGAAIGERDRSKILTVQRVGDRWVMKVDGELRSMPKILRFENKYRWLKDEIQDGGSYEICSPRRELVRGIYRVKVNGPCRPLMASDMAIDFPDDHTPKRLFPDELPRLSDESKWKLASDWAPEYMYTRPLPETACGALPKPDQSNSPPLFARTNAGEWLMYYPLVRLQQNSLDSPLGDGGLSTWAENSTLACSNVPRTFQNEDSCFMSNEPACAASSEAVGHPGSGILVCGSPGEVSNDPELGDYWLDVGGLDLDRAESIGLSADISLQHNMDKERERVWADIAMYGKDQLRQKIAWALYHILAVPKVALGRERRLTEIFVSYYDIFVRNAFGNYRNILKEIAFSPLMAESLTFVNSRSLGNIFLGKKKAIAPDENFARELMQLFTIGLVELNMDGTPVLDASGNTVPTYSNEEIMSFAGVWTGFIRQKSRANIEGRDNRIDPLDIEPHWHDPNLAGGYLGDHYPICSEMPEKLHLRAGAKYRLLGSTPVSHVVHDCRTWADQESRVHVELSRGATGLFEKLCGSDSDCTHPSVVILDIDMTCATVDAPECKVDTVRVVKVGNAFYEYVPSFPCVHYAFIENGQKVTGKTRWHHGVCVNSNSPVASDACCDPAVKHWKDVATRTCLYAGERMLHATAKKRCQDVGRYLCDYGNVGIDESCPHIGHHWTGTPCSTKVKVRGDGKAGIVEYNTGNPPPLLRPDHQNFFTVYWANNEYPTVSDGCGKGACDVVGGECICSVSVSEQAVYSSPPEHGSEILERLHIGATKADLEGLQSSDAQGFTILSSDGSCCDSKTIFVVEDGNGQTKWLKNKNSIVFVGNSTLHFRNPPHFLSLIPSEVSIIDVENEADALLEHLFYHKSTAPFLAIRFIQRFGISSPSPRFVRIVSTAFRDGTYSVDGVVFGAGKYGDLEATFAAVLLDREALSLSLDDSPHEGSLKEPISKVLSFMRALEFKSSTPLIELDLMDRKIGQMAFEQDSVFSFFRPEYSPPGAVTASGLVAPEAEVMLSGKVIGLLNGLFGLVRRGLSSCMDGFGEFGCNTPDISGALAYKPSYTDVPSVVNELCELLTAGRLGTEKQKLIVDAIDDTASLDEVLKTAVELIIVSPEFHTTSKTGSQPIPPDSSSSDEGARGCTNYKAVIHLVLMGGCDSFNMLVPHNSCGKVYDQYQELRDDAALKDSKVLKLEGGNVDGQPCQSFAVHSKLGILRDLYGSGDALFLANAGALSQPCDKDDYRWKTNIKLFGHNTMTDENDRLDPYDGAVGTGSLGRMADMTHHRGCRSIRTAVASIPRNLVGRASMGDPVFALDENGVSPFLVDSEDMKNTMIKLNEGSSGVYADTWSTLFSQSLNQTIDLDDVLSGASTHAQFPNSRLGKRFKLIAELIGAREVRGVDRDYFYVPLGGFDTHADLHGILDSLFGEINDVLISFVAEMKHLGMWDNVVIMQTSDFGRSLSPNSGQGTDHGWGGNCFMAGGSLKGAGVFGQYPEDLVTDSHVLDRGRMVPTMPWEAPFQAIAEWMGIDSDEDLDSIFPNRHKFDNLFSKEDLFHP